MASILIKNPPENIHRWLRATAERNRRSMNQQAIVWLQLCVDAEMRGAFGPSAASPLARGGTAASADVPPWFGIGRDHGTRHPRRHDMAAIRESIGKGLVGERGRK